MPRGISQQPERKTAVTGDPVKTAAQDEIDKVSVLLGKSIRSLRQKREMTQADLATYAELDPNFIGMVERAERRITLYNAWRIAGGLGVSLAELVEHLPTRKPRIPKSRSAQRK